jgi:hypothetical protein
MDKGRVRSKHMVEVVAEEQDKLEIWGVEEKNAAQSAHPAPK